MLKGKRNLNGLRTIGLVLANGISASDCIAIFQVPDRRRQISIKIHQLEGILWAIRL